MEDNFYSYLGLYDKLPKPVRFLAGKFYRFIPYPKRKGFQYSVFSNLILKTQFDSKKNLKEFQWKKISEVLDEAFFHIPFYQNLYKDFKREDIKSFEDFKKLPLITKEMVRDNVKEMCSDRFSESDRFYMTTGGSTGVPMGFFLHKNVSRPKEFAFMDDQWRRVGWSPDDRLVIIRGDIIFDKSDSNNFYKYNYLKNALSLSSFHLVESNIPKYIELINDFKPKFVHAFTSSVLTICKFIRKNNLPKIKGVKAVLISSENLFDEDKHLIAKCFENARVFTWYGHGERALMGGFCEHNDLYHFFPQYGFLEILDPVSFEDSNSGELVGTTFDNLVMPLIRYRTYDLCEYHSDSCSQCGRNYPCLKKIEGRIQEFLVSSSGRLVNSSDLNMHSANFDNIFRLQYYQDTPGKVVFKFVPRPAFSVDDLQRIENELSQKFLDDFVVEFRSVDDIPLRTSGKHGFIDQKLDISKYF